MKKNPENLRLSASQKGFTLLEVMIALAVLSVGLLGMASLTASIIRANSFSDDFTTATALTQDQLENLYNTSFGNLTIGTDIADTNNPIDENGDAGGTYTRTWTIAASGNNKSITVTVAWTSDYGASRSISISTIRSAQT